MNQHHTKIQFKSGPIEYQDVLCFIGAPEHGGQAFFFGAVRNHNQDKQVIKISYEIFAPLAKETLFEICEQAKCKWGEDLKICVIHAQGDLNVGELSVGIGVSCAHRDEAFRACRFIIEEIKHKVPIWKHEYYENGSSGWVKGHALCNGEH